MSFFDKFKQQAGSVADAASGVAQNAVKQTKALASVGKIKLAISSEEDKMKKAYTELGRLYYRDYEAQTEPVPEDYQPWCDKVADAKAQIERLTGEMEQVRAAAAVEEPVAEDAVVEPVEDVKETVEVVLEDAAEPAVDAVEEAAEAVEDIFEDAVEALEEAPAEAPDFEVFQAEPPIGTLYVDETNTEE